MSRRSEIDPETGIVQVVRYTTVNDFGVLVNPMLVEGQAHGGIVQGLGQALMESVAYDEDGQLVTGSFMDYALPRAADAPALGFVSHPVPARTNVLGREGLRRGRMRRGAAGGDERGAGRAAKRWRGSHGHARDAGAGVVGHPGSEGRPSGLARPARVWAW